MYEREKERQRAYDLVMESLGADKKLSKDEIVKRAIEFAQEEVLEFESLYEDFKKRVGHLHVFNQVLAAHFEDYMQHSLKNLRYMIEKTYTKEELEQLPENVYNQVIAIQKNRAELLRSIAKTYFTE